MKFLIAALAPLALMSIAQAQTAPVDAPPVVAEPVSPPPADDPLALANSALAQARLGESCRFAFTQKNIADVRAGWATADAEVEFTFDPRLPIGTRFTMVRAAKQEKAIAKNLVKTDKLAQPYDLIALLPEGEFKIEQLAPKASTQTEVALFTFKPSVIVERSDSEMGVKLVNQYEGTLEVDRATGRVRTVTIRVPEGGAKAGIVKMTGGMFARAYAVVGDSYVAAERITQSQSARALWSTAEVTSGTQFSNVTPICDAAEVARIAEMEAAARPKKKN
jgi:hypothetical protein